MPWPAKQQRAIAAELQRKGRSRKQISDFFKSHGGPVVKTKPRKRKAEAIVTRG